MTAMRYSAKSRAFLALAGVFILMLACSTSQPAAAPTNTPPPTNTPAPSDTPAPTATPAPSDTPAPTATPVPTDTPVPTETPVPTDTRTPTPDRTGTAAARATENAAEIITQINETLQKYNLSTEQGSLGWVSDEPIELTVDQYGQAFYVPIADEKVFSDFAMQVDITWDSSSGLAGCGIIFRSEDNIEEGEQYFFFTIRLSGLPMYDIQLRKYGEYQSSLMGRPKTNSAIKQDAGSTNTYLLLANEKALSVYANETRLTNATIGKLAKGKIAFWVSQESGSTTCLFTNGWLWRLK